MKNLLLSADAIVQQMKMAMEIGTRFKIVVVVRAAVVFVVVVVRVGE